MKQAADYADEVADRLSRYVPAAVDDEFRTQLAKALEAMMDELGEEPCEECAGWEERTDEAEGRVAELEAKLNAVMARCGNGQHIPTEAGVCAGCGCPSSLLL